MPKMQDLCERVSSSQVKYQKMALENTQWCSWGLQRNESSSSCPPWRCFVGRSFGSTPSSIPLPGISWPLEAVAFASSEPPAAGLGENTLVLPGGIAFAYRCCVFFWILKGELLRMQEQGCALQNGQGHAPGKWKESWVVWPPDNMQ